MNVRPMEILIDHPWFLVVNKPSGLLTQAVPGIPSVQTRLADQLQTDPSVKPFVGIPHRLDRVTSGALVVARNQRALKRLCDQFASRTVTKIYHAVVHGTLSQASGRFVDWIRKIPDVAKAETIDPTHLDAREAILEYSVLGSCESSRGQNHSLVEIRLETGRMHQIRLQFALRGHPIVGDSLYGSDVRLAPEETEEREQPIALHARTLEFRNPQNLEFVSASAPYPDIWPFAKS